MYMLPHKGIDFNYLASQVSMVALVNSKKGEWYIPIPFFRISITEYAPISLPYLIQNN